MCGRRIRICNLSLPAAGLLTLGACHCCAGLVAALLVAAADVALVGIVANLAMLQLQSDS